MHSRKKLKLDVHLKLFLHQYCGNGHRMASTQPSHTSRGSSRNYGKFLRLGNRLIHFLRLRKASVLNATEEEEEEEEEDVADKEVEEDEGRMFMTDVDVDSGGCWVHGGSADPWRGRGKLDRGSVRRKSQKLRRMDTPRVRKTRVYGDRKALDGDSIEEADKYSTNAHVGEDITLDESADPGPTKEEEVTEEFSEEADGDAKAEQGTMVRWT